MMSDVLDTWKDYFARINERRAAQNRRELENWLVDSPTFSI
jgi:hypothetical protein